MWDKLKKVLQVSGGRGVIVEDGEPRYVILPVDEYLQLKSGSQNMPESTSPGSAGLSDMSRQQDFHHGNIGSYESKERLDDLPLS